MIRFRIERHLLFTTTLDARQYKKFHGVFMAMCGVAAFSGSALLVSALFDYPRGIDGAITLFALSMGMVSSGALEASTRKRREVGVPISFLIANFILTVAAVWLSTDLIPR